MARLSEDTFDLVLLDVAMEEMNGFQVMERMALQNLHTPVIMITGYASTESAVAALRKGAYDYLKKPFEPEELLTSVKNAINQKMLKKDNNRVKRRLRDSEEHFKTLFNHASDCIFVVEPTNIDGPVIIDVNEAACKAYGYTSDEFIGKPFSSIGTKEERKKGPERMQRLMSGEQLFFESEHIRKDGTLFSIEVSARMIHIGGKPFIYAIERDITERKRAEVALTASENKYKKLVETISDVIYEVDDQGNITYVSPVGLKIWGDNPSEIIGRNFIELVHPEDRECLIKRFSGLRHGVEGPETYRFVNKSGRIIWVRSRTIPVMEKGVFKGARGILSDITAQKQAQEERLKLEKRLQQAQKAESLSRMAGAIAHHFNNQLGVVIGNLELSMEDLPRGNMPLENLTEALKGARRAAEVSGLMLAYLGQTTAKKEPMDICDVCSGSLPLFRAALPKRILLATNLVFPGPVIRGNENQIQQILANLVTNAQEAVGDGLGAIELTVRTVLATEIPVTVCFPIGWQPQDKVYACLEVTDSGCGIEEKDMEQLFDPFFTSKFFGRGLGLAVVLGILRTHSGAITVESEPGRGSIFRIFLPVSAEAAACPPQKAAKAPEMGEGGTVLLVEDDEQVRKMVGAMLKHLGFSVLEAKDGFEAVEVFRRQKDEIRCVLCDLTMPRMDGWETLSALRKLAPGIPVILASGYDKSQVMASDHPERPQAFLQKPFSMKDLVTEIRQVLAQESDTTGE